MPDFKMSDVKQVRETTSINTATSYLAEGWVMLGTSNGKDETGYPITSYSLGWIREENPPKSY